MAFRNYSFTKTTIPILSLGLYHFLACSVLALLLCVQTALAGKWKVSSFEVVQVNTGAEYTHTNTFVNSGQTYTVVGFLGQSDDLTVSQALTIYKQSMSGTISWTDRRGQHVKTTDVDDYTVQGAFTATADTATLRVVYEDGTLAPADTALDLHFVRIPETTDTGGTDGNPDGGGTDGGGDGNPDGGGGQPDGGGQTTVTDPIVVADSSTTTGGGTHTDGGNGDCCCEVTVNTNVNVGGAVVNVAPPVVNVAAPVVNVIVPMEEVVQCLSGIKEINTQIKDLLEEIKDEVTTGGNFTAPSQTPLTDQDIPTAGFTGIIPELIKPNDPYEKEFEINMEGTRIPASVISVGHGLPDMEIDVHGEIDTLVHDYNLKVIFTSFLVFLIGAFTFHRSTSMIAS